MSTRGIIVFVGKGCYGVPRGYRLYQHSDSYPTYALPIIRDVIRKAEKLVVEGREMMASDKYEVTPAMLAGLYVGENTSIFGMGARIEESKVLKSPITPVEIVGLLGDQGDLEWIYVVDTDAKAVNVYGGGYTGDLPEKCLEAGLVDPLSYAEQLSEGFQESEAKAIKSVKRSLARLGWPVNPVAPKTGRRAAIEAEKAKAA